MVKPETRKNNVTTYAGIVFLGIFVFILYHMFKGFYLNILLGVVLAISLRPLHKKITKLLFGKVKLASLATIILTLVLILLPLFFLLKTLADQAVSVGRNTNLSGLEKTLDSVISEVNAKADKYFKKPDLLKKDEVLSFIQTKATSVGQSLLGVLTNAFSIIASSIILFMTIYYTLTDWDRLRNYIYSYSPLADKATRQMSTRALNVIRATIKGNMVMIFVQAFAGGLGLWFFGIKSPILLGALYGLASLVPTIGTGTIWIPSVIFLAITGNYVPAIGLALWNMAVVGSLDNFIMPMLVRRGASLHPFLILTGVLGGISLFGLVGFIIGPTILALTLVSLELLKEDEENYSTKGFSPSAI
jgi:predicted PurR-regulated permease PerM